jgi:hypothetical protein
VLSKKKASISKLNNICADLRGKLRKQKSLYEQVKQDRQLYFKNLQEGLEEISQIKNKFRDLYQQSDQLKDDIKDKDGEEI